MLNKLLWRCPVCKTKDSIVHRKRFLRPDLVNCHACGSVWELRRVKGGTDFRFRAIGGAHKGTERPLAAWYDMMREGFALEALSDAAAPLEPGETLYLKGHANGMSVLRMDPRFQAAIAKLPPSDPPAPGAPPMVAIGQAYLFLTDRRLIVVRPDGEATSLALASVRGVHLLIDRFLFVRHERRLIERFEFIEESPLKWQVHLDLALRPIAEAGGFKFHIAYD